MDSDSNQASFRCSSQKTSRPVYTCEKSFLFYRPYPLYDIDLHRQDHNRTTTPECKEALSTSAAAPPLRRRSNPVDLDSSDDRTVISFSIRNDSIPGLLVGIFLRSAVSIPMSLASMVTFTVACLVTATIFFRPRMEPFQPVVSAAREYVLRITGFTVTAINICERCTKTMSDRVDSGNSTSTQIPMTWNNSAGLDTDLDDRYLRFPVKIAKRRIEALRQNTFRLAKLWMNMSSIKRLNMNDSPSISEQSRGVQECMPG